MDFSLVSLEKKHHNTTFPVKISVQKITITKKITITGLTGDEFKFNQHGDGPARYNIIHYKQLSKGIYQWITVGNFYDEEMELNMDGKH